MKDDDQLGTYVEPQKEDVKEDDVEDYVEIIDYEENEKSKLIIEQTLSQPIAVLEDIQIQSEKKIGNDGQYLQIFYQSLDEKDV